MTHAHDEDENELAALPAPVAAAPVGVKALEWHPGEYPNTWDAEQPYGIIRIVYDERAFPETAYGCCIKGEFKWVPSLEAAQAFAQADFEARIRSALIAPAKPAVEVVEALAAKLGNLQIGTKKRFDETTDMWYFELWHALGDAIGALQTPVTPDTRTSEALDGPVENEIDRLRYEAFKTNSNEDKAAYYLATSKWFQDRHSSAIAAPATPDAQTEVEK